MRSGIIYRIEYKEDPNIRYIGSTLQELKYRWRDHKTAYKNWLKNKDLNKVAIFPFFEKHGLENFTITTIKKYTVVDREHLRVYETLWFNKLENININSPFNPIPKKIIDELYRNSHKDEIAEYNRKNYEKNKDKIFEKINEWREENKEEIKERRAKHYQEHKSEIQASQKSNYEAKKEEYVDRSRRNRQANPELYKNTARERYLKLKAQVVNCECGKQTNAYAQKSHLKTKFHKTYLESLSS